MAHSWSMPPTALRSNVTAFAEGMRTCVPQRRALPCEVVQGMERLGRVVQALHTRHHWSFSTLAIQSGIPWLRLTLREQVLLLPIELTPETLHTLGQAFPFQHTGPTSAVLFCPMAQRLCALRLPTVAAPVTRDGHPAALWLVWQADVPLAGTFWTRFTRPEDATVVLAEVPLGSALAGEEVCAAQALGFDPTCELWALTFLLREPAP